MEERIALSQRQEQRLFVIRMSLEGKLTVREAALRLDLSSRHVRRLRQRVQAHGRAALRHGNTGRAPRNRISEPTRRQVVGLAQGRYAGFNDHHLTEKLTEDGLRLSRSTVQRILRTAGIASPRKRRPPRHRSRRPRRAQAGALLLWDGSPHAWLEDRGPQACLVGTMDDATGGVLAGYFALTEDAATYLRLLHTLVTSHGIPLAIYMDQHGIFKRNDPHWTLAEELAGRQEPTQVGRALEALGISPIYARSPQAKGRIERLWGVFQDRLVSELRLAQVQTLAHAQAVLEAFLPRYNARFAQLPADAQPAWRPLPTRLDLERLLSFSYPATVLNDNTVRLHGHCLQVPPGAQGRGFAHVRVEVRQLLDGSWRIYHGDQLIATAPATTPGPLRTLKRRRPHPASSLEGDRIAERLGGPIA